MATGDESVAAVASKLLLYHQPTILNGVGGAMNRLGYTWDLGMFEEDEGQYDQSREVLFASAGAALFRRVTFLESGGFDEGFFMYHEDVDLCWRFWLLGFRVVTAPAAVAFHHFGASTQAHQGMTWRELLGERHNMRALLKNYEARNLRSALWGLLKRPQPPVRKWNQCRNFFWNLRRLPDTLKRRKWNQDAAGARTRNCKSLLYNRTMSQSASEVSVVTVNWNGQDHLTRLLPSLMELGVKEVIVVNNGSTDGSKSFVRRNYPQVQLLENQIVCPAQQPRSPPSPWPLCRLHQQ